MNTWLNYFFRDWKGNIGRIERIYKEDYRWFVNHAVKILQDEEKAKEIVIAAFKAAGQQHEDFQSEDEIFNFLSTTIEQNCNGARMKMLQEMQQEKRQEIKQDEKIKKFILKWGKENYIITKAVRDAVHEEIEALPWQRRRIFRLFFCGLSTAKTAEIVGREEQTVRNERRLASISLFEALQQRNLLFSENLPPCNSSGFISESEA